MATSQRMGTELGGSQTAHSTRPQQMHPSKDLVKYIRDYAKEKPDAAALWCFGIGFVVGWKLKPW